MKQIPQSITMDPTPGDDQCKPTQHGLQKKKNKGAMHILRAALFIMRGHRSRKSREVRVEDGSKSVLSKVVGSMRPLHLQSNKSSGSISQITTAPPSPSISASEEEPYSPSPTSSRYASAVGLNELVESDEENEKQEMIIEEINEHDDGDEMVDSKAEEFIARFYEQMRLQRLDSADRRYNERSQRSLGL